MGDNVNVTMYDPDYGAVMVNETEWDLDPETVKGEILKQAPEMAALVRWTMTTRGDIGRGRQGGIFARDRYVTPEQIFAQFDTARDALGSDDIVSGVQESTESLAFNRMAFTADDEDEEDVWNQIAFDIDIDSRIREMWRELFTISQFYAVTWWGTKSYKVTGTTPAGVKRKKIYEDLRVPLGITLLDPKKVVPVGNLMFNQEQLAYIADRTEVDMLDAAVLNDPGADPVSRQIIVAKYEPPDYERRNLARLGVNAEWLYILNPRNVWRHTLTRPQFERFADVRMKSIFEMLDLKHQLRQMDRATLIGGTNWILLIKKGTEHHPAKPQEIANLNEQVKTVAQVPILVGDHRLAVEIITPKTDMTLSGDKYGVIDNRITTRLYQMFLVHGGEGAPRSDDSIKLAKVIGRGLEARRFMLRRTLERQIIGPAVKGNPQLESIPKLRFHPTRIQLDLDPAFVQLIMDVRDRGDLSRESMLNELDYDQEDEARQRQREERDYDHIFTPTNVPFDAPVKTGAPAAVSAPAKAPAPTKAAPAKVTAPAKKAATRSVAAPRTSDTRSAPTPRAAGRQGGGTRNGGGAAPGSGQGRKKTT